MQDLNLKQDVEHGSITWNQFSLCTTHTLILLSVHKQECYQRLSAISILTLRSTINSSQQRLCQRENLNILIPHNERTAAAAAYYVVSDLLSQNGHVGKH